jgi:hypothetical protein
MTQAVEGIIQGIPGNSNIALKITCSSSTSPQTEATRIIDGGHASMQRRMTPAIQSIIGGVSDNLNIARKTARNGSGSPQAVAARIIIGGHTRVL